MNLRRNAVVSPKVVKVVAAIIVGLSVGTLVPPEPVVFPAIGAVSGVAVGGVGLVAGVVLYVWVPTLVSSSECGCAGECGCS